LTHLDVSVNELTNTAMNALSTTQLLKNLTSLILYGNSIGNETAQLIKDNTHLSRLTNLDISNMVTRN